MAMIPLLMDDSGYQVQQSDLTLVGVENEALEAMLDGELPLGMSSDEYEEFVNSLLYALQRDRVDVADVRIKGSAVNFFSGRHKLMPHEREDIYRLYIKYRENLPPADINVSRLQLDRFVALIRGLWPDGADRPKRPMFDALYSLGIAPDRSDYDVQISSDRMYELVEQHFEYLNLKPGRIEVDDPEYAYMDQKYVYMVFHYLAAWVEQMYSQLGRPVEIAVFRSAGPPPTSGNVGMTSRFRDDDWILQSHKGLSE